MSQKLSVNQDQKPLLPPNGSIFHFLLFQNVQSNDLLKSWSIPHYFEVQAVFKVFFFYLQFNLIRENVIALMKTIYEFSNLINMIQSAQVTKIGVFSGKLPCK